MPHLAEGSTGLEGEEQLSDEVDPMKLDIYLNYGGNCEQAFRFYEQHLGGKITTMIRHGEQPDQANVPADWKAAILHARIEIGGTVLMGADIPGAEPLRSAYLTLSADSAEEAERLYALLSDGGQIFMKMEETFFASRFAQLRDKFGTSWMLLHD
jgi:PhnB protein